MTEYSPISLTPQMTAAQRERNEIQIRWLEEAIAAQQRHPQVRVLDPKSLTLVNPRRKR